MNKAERAALLQELKRTTGQINPDGSPFIDDGEIADPKVLSEAGNEYWLAIVRR